MAQRSALQAARLLLYKVKVKKMGDDFLKLDGTDGQPSTIMHPVSVTSTL